MPEIGSGYDKELISFAILFMLHILCDVIHDVIDKHVYIWQICFIWQSNSFGNNASVTAAKGKHFDWCFKWCRYTI